MVTGPSLRSPPRRYWQSTFPPTPATHSCPKASRFSSLAAAGVTTSPEAPVSKMKAPTLRPSTSGHT
eukprot:637608-Prorocentrum_minimum.AAC.1